MNNTTTPEQVQGIRSKNSLYCKTGRLNGYRDAFKKGLGASRMDSTWDREQKIHTCCGSKVAWKHKAKCEVALKNRTPETMEAPEKMEEGLEFSSLPKSKIVEAPPIEPIPEKKKKKVDAVAIKHSFGCVDPDDDVYKGMDNRTGRCGRSVLRKNVTNVKEDVTCKNCINLINNAIK